jgi:hypothetical protein
MNKGNTFMFNGSKFNDKLSIVGFVLSVIAQYLLWYLEQVNELEHCVTGEDV